MLSFDEIKELIALVRDGQLQGVEIEERSGQRIRISGRNAAPSAPQPAGGAPTPIVSASASGELSQEAARVETGTGGREAERGAPAAVEEEEGGHKLTSPIVGTFYATPSPDAAPYVKVGDSVEKGQVLCIVEAMKLMNEIESDVQGTIKKIFPRNAQPVEYGEPLFLIDLA